jgi:hypothetical protein
MEREPSTDKCHVIVAAECTVKDPACAATVTTSYKFLYSRLGS